jgi:hypothetical protein
MFSTPSSTSEPLNYDFEKEENAAKWKGVFVNSLRKVTVVAVWIARSGFFCISLK